MGSRVRVPPRSPISHLCLGPLTLSRNGFLNFTFRGLPHKNPFGVEYGENRPDPLRYFAALADPSVPASFDRLAIARLTWASISVSTHPTRLSPIGTRLGNLPAASRRSIWRRQ